MALKHFHAIMFLMPSHIVWSQLSAESENFITDTTDVWQTFSGVGKWIILIGIAGFLNCIAH